MARANRQTPANLKNAGKGRKRGVPNKITQDVRKTMALFAERNIGELEGWIDRVAKNDPARAADLYLRALEYHVPKLARTEIANPVDSEGFTFIFKQYTPPAAPGANNAPQ